MDGLILGLADCLLQAFNDAVVVGKSFDDADAQQNSRKLVVRLWCCFCRRADSSMHIFKIHLNAAMPIRQIAIEQRARRVKEQEKYVQSEAWIWH